MMNRVYNVLARTDASDNVISDSAILEFPEKWQHRMHEHIASVRAFNATLEDPVLKCHMYVEQRDDPVLGIITIRNNQRYVVDDFPSFIRSDGWFEYSTNNAVSRKHDLPASWDLQYTTYYERGYTHRYLGPSRESIDGTHIWSIKSRTRRRKYCAFIGTTLCGFNHHDLFNLAVA